LRFLLSRRWLGLLLAVAVVGVTCVELGLWQFRRYHERIDRNEVTTSNLMGDPAPVEDVLSTNAPPAEVDQWRIVEATGRFDADHQVVVSYRTRDGAPGVDVVVPLVTASGTALLVDRGWLATENNADTPQLPDPPAGEVTVTGWVRVNADDGDQVKPQDGTVRAISSDALAPTLPYDVYDGFVDLTSEAPKAPDRPLRAERPDLTSGPHFFYGVQWFFFAALAFGFWCYFAWTEYRGQSRPSRPRGPSQPASEPAVDGQHDAGHVVGRG